MATTKTEVTEPTTAEKALTIHPKVTGAIVAGIVAHYIIVLLAHYTSWSPSSADEVDLTLVIVAIGGWLAPNRSAQLPAPEETA